MFSNCSHFARPTPLPLIQAARSFDFRGVFTFELIAPRLASVTPDELHPLWRIKGSCLRDKAAATAAAGRAADEVRKLRRHEDL
jgi:hypothetical protein